MILREAPDLTLRSVRQGMEKTTGKFMQVPNAKIRLDLENERTISLDDKVQVEANATGIQAIGDWLEVPSKFLLRSDPDIQQFVLQTMLDRQGAAVANVSYGEGGINTIRDPKVKFIEPVRIVNIAAKVISDEAPVIDHWNTIDEFRLDAIAPEGFDRGIGGDRKKGDITRGGIRIGMDTKHNLAPWVSEFMYRLVCTNGMERVDEGLKVDARGNTVDEVLAEFEAMADTAFRRVEQTIASFYEMRDKVVANPERTLLRIADEQGISSRQAFAMAETVPALGDVITEFDIVNHITNFANTPKMKAGPRRKFQVAGGNLVADHADRCSHCQSRLGH